jgi:thioredoxin
MELTDQNFEAKIKNSEKPVLVDFFAEWCQPCFVLGPILEKIAKDLEDKIILAKVNLDSVPLIAQKFGIDRIPTVILFKKGNPVSGFVGLYPEPLIKEWLEKNLGGENEEDKKAIDQKVERLIKEYEDYAKEKGIKLNPNREVVERIVKGLLSNEEKYGKRYCPCRRVSGNQVEDAKNICPCTYHLQELEKFGHCLCGLFVK